MPRPPCWYLSFDCATATFAFSLSRVDLGPVPRLQARARGLRALAGRLVAAGAAAPAADVAAAAAAAAALDAETRALVRIVDGETAVLFPGVADRDIPTVARLKRVAEYVERRVRPAAARRPAGEPLCVLVEYQMGANAPARAVAAALITLFAAEEVYIVGPSLKNKVATCEAGRYCYFAERYKRAYDANKAHAMFNFAKMEELFGTGIPPSRPAALRGHIADSFMQVIGHLKYGGTDDEAAARY